MPNFSDIASKPMASIERPPLPPVGTYQWRVTKLPDRRFVGQDNMYEVVEFPMQAQEALDNVDMADYKGDVHGIFNRKTFMFDTTDEAKFDQTLFQLRTFLEKHLKCSDETMSLNEAINASVGSDCLGDLKWRQDKNDQELFFAEISKTAPID